MKTLVVYGTGTGCTAGVVEKIGERLAAAGATVDVVSAREADDAADYDSVIVGSGVRAGQWHAPVKRWLQSNAADLKGMPVAFFTVGLTVADQPEKADEVRAYTDPLVEQTGVSPVDVGVFAGWNQPKEFPFLERAILRVMKAPEGDFRDFDAIAAWTDSVATKLIRA